MTFETDSVASTSSRRSLCSRLCQAIGYQPRRPSAGRVDAAMSSAGRLQVRTGSVGSGRRWHGRALGPALTRDSQTVAWAVSRPGGTFPVGEIGGGYERAAVRPCIPDETPPITTPLPPMIGTWLLNRWHFQMGSGVRVIISWWHTGGCAIRSSGNSS